LGAYLTKKELPFEPGPWDEDIFWLCGEAGTLSLRERVGVRAGPGGANFPDGGMYLLRGANSKAVIRCTDFRTRPSHADQLHVDLWWRGQNIACDAGTYLYTGKGMWRNGLAHTSAHNTVIVDRQDQMKMVSRFTWTDYARGHVLKQDARMWQGEHDGYQKLPDPVTHIRTVMLLDEDRWLVVDHLNGRQSHHYALHWLLCDGEYGVQEVPKGRAPAHGLLLAPAGSKLSDSKVLIQMGLTQGEANLSIVRADREGTRGWRSRYYGHKEPAISVMLETGQPSACFWTYFGFDSDRAKLGKDDLHIEIDGTKTSINLQSLIL
jgi:asparagine synthase (glutamine-hydrolysing)